MSSPAISTRPTLGAKSKRPQRKSSDVAPTTAPPPPPDMIVDDRVHAADGTSYKPCPTCGRPSSGPTVNRGTQYDLYDLDGVDAVMVLRERRFHDSLRSIQEAENPRCCCEAELMMDRFGEEGGDEGAAHHPGSGTVVGHHGECCAELEDRRRYDADTEKIREDGRRRRLDRVRDGGGEGGGCRSERELDAMMEEVGAGRVAAAAASASWTR